LIIFTLKNHLGKCNENRPGLALAKQLYLSVMAMGKGTKGTQALYLALEKMSAMD
jgi:hypothetical protein